MLYCVSSTPSSPHLSKAIVYSTIKWGRMRSAQWFRNSECVCITRASVKTRFLILQNQIFREGEGGLQITIFKRCPGNSEKQPDLGTTGLDHGSANYGSRANLACYCFFVCVVLFWCGPWAKNGFYIFLTVKIKNQNISWPMTFKFPCPRIWFCWNTATLVCLHTVCSCFPFAKAELSSCSRECI